MQKDNQSFGHSDFAYSIGVGCILGIYEYYYNSQQWNLCLTHIRSAIKQSEGFKSDFHRMMFYYLGYTYFYISPVDWYVAQKSLPVPKTSSNHNSKQNSLNPNNDKNLISDVSHIDPDFRYFLFFVFFIFVFLSFDLLYLLHPKGTMCEIAKYCFFATHCCFLSLSIN